MASASGQLLLWPPRRCQLCAIEASGYSLHSLSNIGVEAAVSKHWGGKWTKPKHWGFGTITPTLFVLSGDTRFSLIHLIADILLSYIPENVSCLNFCRTLSIIFEFYFDAFKEKN